MPPKKRKSIGKPDKENAKRVSAARDRETSAEREQRNAATREGRVAGRSRESSAEREQRNAAIRERRAAGRSRESSAEREQRTAANRERMAAGRSRESSVEREQRIAADRQRKAAGRSRESSAEREQRTAANRERMAAGRSRESSAEREQRTAVDRQRKEARRSRETSTQREQRTTANKENMAVRRGRQTEAERQQQNAADRNRVGAARARFRNNPRQYRARHADDVMNGLQQVLPSDVGAMYQADGTPSLTAKICEHCQAVKWQSETPGMCCSSGKVSLLPFEDHPQVFRALWEGQDDEAKTFRKYSRQMNNALSLACLKVQTPPVPGRAWRPSVTIQGKVFVGMGPLQPADGETPLFSQLYVLDPDHSSTEQELRLNSMCLPNSTSAAERQQLQRLLATLQAELRQCNRYVQDFKFACEVMQQDHSDAVQLILDEKKRPEGEHARRFNAGFKEISVLMNDEKPGDRAFVISHRAPGRQVHEILDTHRSADPMHFILFFPTGADGWHLGLPRDPDTQGTIPPLQFYAFHLQIRYEPGIHHSDILFRGARLFQEYCCVMYAKVENQRLKYIANNQKQLRGEKYSRLCEDVHTHHNNANNDNPLRSGRKIILPPSFTGGPRYMHAHFQDAMAIVREFHKPDFFITFTCNPEWPEIKRSLLPNQKPHDRPDIIARVFNQKLKDFMTEIKKDSILGRMCGFVDVVEFQKRGLPHVHLLLILKADDRLRTAHDVDKAICAELPPDPDTFPAGPERNQARRLQEIVLNNMVHTCSNVCLDDNGKCKKGFPKPFCDTTQWEKNAFYPNYRRRSPAQGGRSIMQDGQLIDNSYIVPYNPYLALKYGGHINIESCVSPTAAKYLFRYVTKGSDRSMVAVDYDDEVTHFQNMRSIGASEACWRMFQFVITERYPAVMDLRIHLEGEEYTIFNEGEEEAAVNQGSKKTELTAFFQYNTSNPETQVRYIDFPKHFTWNARNKTWKRRQRGFGGTIARIHTIHPRSGDEYYLRMLLIDEHCRGATSYANLRTVNGELCDTFKEVCNRLGYLENDNQWHETLQEAALTNLPREIRQLFVFILLEGDPSDPLTLFQSHVSEWWDDFQRQFPEADDNLLKNMVLMSLELILQEQGKELKDYGLDIVPDEYRTNIDQLMNQAAATALPVLIQEELNFDFEATARAKDDQLTMLTDSQRAVYDTVMDAVQNHQPLHLFIDARGGTGKTFTLKTILAAVRTLDDTKNIAIAVATSGIAANLLPLGRTFHSRFKAPINIDENGTLAITPTDMLAQLIRESKLIVWDEAPMAKRYLLEALDRSLRDITNQNVPFGGKVLILAGDFRQVLPVVPRGSRADITASSIKKSDLWNLFTVMSLTENMRVGQDPALRAFDDWTLQIGDGDVAVKECPDKIEIPDEFCFEINDQSPDTVKKSINDFIDLIFPNFVLRSQQNQDAWIQWIAERAIVTPINAAVDQINSTISDRFPGDPTTFSSADTTVEPDDLTRFPVEYLNSLTPQGLPPHRLFLKNGMILMLLRNLRTSKGLSNGVRLILTKCTRFILQCKVASGDHFGENVLIPRIILKTNDKQFPFEWKRRQFPVRPAFAMTINKSQGNTLKTIGVWLENPVFTHGQLYVAISRVGHPTHLHLAMNNSDKKLTRNVVYKEIL